MPKSRQDIAGIPSDDKQNELAERETYCWWFRNPPNQLALRISPCFHRISFITSDLLLDFWTFHQPVIFCESKSLPAKLASHQGHPLKSLLKADLSRSSRRCSLRCQTVDGSWFRLMDEIPIGPNHRLDVFCWNPCKSWGFQRPFPQLPSEWILEFEKPSTVPS